MITDIMEDTYYDSPERTPIEKIQEYSKEVLQSPLIVELLEGLNNAVVILDQNRQIVVFNQIAENLFKTYNTELAIGKRLGEALNCIHSNIMPAGCGTSQFCKECGAANAIRTHKESFLKEVRECRITSERPDLGESSLDLKVSASQLKINSHQYIIFTLQDISNEKRRHALERIFFHDILNTAGAIKGISDILYESDNPEEVLEFKDLLSFSSSHLIQEIQSQRELLQAESGQLKVNPFPIGINSILQSLYAIYSKHDIAKGKTIQLSYLDKDETITTDVVLLTRSLGNLMKNALEATTNFEIPVKCWVELEANHVSFHIKNDSVMPESIQLQMFQRSFSTKGEIGRGIGTYSVKLLVQQYLNGSVFFISNAKDKTVFTIKIPKVLV
ncbi:MAG: HAMP domain-containing histidine kinase [Ignavibacteriaceae bacterium]|nr:HAMP domain-containing histidine kinase [Ignavibacteriaceae bacterium]